MAFEEGKKFLMTKEGSAKEFHLLNRLETRNQGVDFYEYYVELNTEKAGFSTLIDEIF